MPTHEEQLRLNFKAAAMALLENEVSWDEIDELLEETIDDHVEAKQES